MGESTCLKGKTQFTLQNSSNLTDLFHVLLNYPGNSEVKIREDLKGFF